MTTVPISWRHALAASGITIATLGLAEPAAAQLDDNSRRPNRTAEDVSSARRSRAL
jgi:hypothetical protein